VAPAVVFTNNIVSIAGIDVGTGTTISFAFQATAPGTFSLNFGNTIGGIAIVSKQSQGWVTYAQGGTGSVSVTTLTAHHVVGTFAFDAVGSSGGATGVMHVTNGKFDITF